ncbi:MAG: class I SAM-dependent methyltransferase [Candidatus Omnitrophota bacterium]|jgi:ubiquinone/menaquinone biosynthesis C-methylase UbiE
MIIKSFRREGESGYCGQDVESWTERWDNAEDLTELFKKADKDYLSIFFKKYFPKPPKRILEGGCGTGKYVFAYRKMGYDIIGVDFSAETIKRIKDIDGSLPVYEGDVTKLSFEDQFFDCYFSGGVIEHFEQGPDIVIKEARRVLKTGGLFLATVPYVNFLRKVYFNMRSISEKKGILQKNYNDCKLDEVSPDKYRFCEYFFDVASLKPYFEKNGFTIEKTFPMNFIWGEVGKPLHKYIHMFKTSKSSSGSNSANKEKDKHIIKDLAKDFLIIENRNNMFFRYPLTFINYLSGNMVLIAAKAV